MELIMSYSEWTPIGPRFSNSVLQTLLVLLARRPPKVSKHCYVMKS